MKYLKAIKKTIANFMQNCHISFRMHMTVTPFVNLGKYYLHVLLLACLFVYLLRLYKTSYTDTLTCGTKTREHRLAQVVLTLVNKR